MFVGVMVGFGEGVVGRDQRGRLRLAGGGGGCIRGVAARKVEVLV